MELDLEFSLPEIFQTIWNNEEFMVVTKYQGMNLNVHGSLQISKTSFAQNMWFISKDMVPTPMELPSRMIRLSSSISTNLWKTNVRIVNSKLE